MFTNGIDIVYIPRIKKLIKKPYVLSKIFTQKELEYWQEKKHNLDVLAGIYAAKEAFLKASGFNLANILSLNIEISHNENGAPFYTFYNELKEKTKSFKISLSISHDANYAIASTIIFK